MEIADIERLIERAENELWTPELRYQLQVAATYVGVRVLKHDHCGDIADALRREVREARSVRSEGKGS